MDASTQDDPIGRPPGSGHLFLPDKSCEAGFVGGEDHPLDGLYAWLAFTDQAFESVDLFGWAP